MPVFFSDQTKTNFKSYGIFITAYYCIFSFINVYVVS